MTEAVFDFKDINRRMNRKPVAIEIKTCPLDKPVCKVCNPDPVVVPPKFAGSKLAFLREWLDYHDTIFIGYDFGRGEQ
jgi:hypothetical protein